MPGTRLGALAHRQSQTSRSSLSTDRDRGVSREPHKLAIDAKTEGSTRAVEGRKGGSMSFGETLSQELCLES